MQKFFKDYLYFNKNKVIAAFKYPPIKSNNFLENLEEDQYNYLKKGTVFFSTIVIKEKLKESLKQNKRYCKKINFIEDSIIEHRALAAMHKNLPTEEELLSLFKDFNIDTCASNLAIPEENNKFLLELKNKFLDQLKYTYYSQIIDQDYISFKYENTLVKNKNILRLKTIKKFNKTWPKEYLKLFMPIIRSKYERIINLPYPLEEDYQYQQFIFYKTKLEEQLNYHQLKFPNTLGNNPENRLLLSLNKQSPIKTIILGITSKNKSILLGFYNDLKIITYSKEKLSNNLNFIRHNPKQPFNIKED